MKKILVSQAKILVLIGMVVGLMLMALSVIFWSAPDLLNGVRLILAVYVVWQVLDLMAWCRRKWNI